MRSFLLGLVVLRLACSQTPVGIFDGESDIGAVAHPGSASHDDGVYRVTASGANMWANADEFHFVWKKVMPGDFQITAGISILTAGGNAHRKGVIMMRQSLEPGSAYVSAALHGDGLASLQSRQDQGGSTYEVQSSVSKPRVFRLVRNGDFAYLFVDQKFSGGSMLVKWKEPFYIGIGACAHDADALVDVAFDHVRIEPAGAAKLTRFSTLEVVPYPTGDRQALYAVKGALRGPTWTKDGGALIVSHDGRLERISKAGAETLTIRDAPFPCESFQGISPDGRRMAISCGVKPSVYVVDLEARALEAKRITHKIPTVWHGWAPDGESFLYTIDRRMRRDFARMPSKPGGKEIRITSNGMSSNPEFSRDGTSIYFNSDKGGTMQVWRMPSSGGAAEQVTSDDFNNWYPHLSPDGKRILMVSCGREVKGPPEDGAVQLRVYNLETKRFQSAARILTGGRGTIDSPSWSPDGKRIAFVTYQFLPEKP